MVTRRSLLLLLGTGATSTAGCLGVSDDPDEDTAVDRVPVYNMEVSGERIATDAVGEPSSSDLHRIFLWNSGSASLSLSLAVMKSGSETPSFNETYDLLANSHAQIFLFDADDYELKITGDGIEEPWNIVKEWFVEDCWKTVMRFDTRLLQAQSKSDDDC